MLSIKKKTLNLMFVLVFALASLGAAVNLWGHDDGQNAAPAGYFLVDEGDSDGECAVASSSCVGM